VIFPQGGVMFPQGGVMFLQVVMTQGLRGILMLEDFPL
jgi:hypothetical protein